MKFLIVFLGLFFIQSSAQSGFMIYPQKLIFEGKNKKQSIKVTNLSPESKTYRIKITNYRQKSDGSYAKALTEKGLESKIRFSPRKVTLKPKETQTINVMLRQLNSLSDGEHQAYISVIEKEKSEFKEDLNPSGSMGFKIGAEYGMSAPIIVRKGKVSFSLEIQKVNVIKNKNGNAALNIDLKHLGNKSFRGNINLLEGGKNIGVIKNISIYPNIDMRSIRVNLVDFETKKPLEVYEVRGKKIQVVISSEKEDSEKFELIQEFKL